MISIKLRKIDTNLKNYLNKNKADLLIIGVFFNEPPKTRGLDSQDVKILKEAIALECFKGKKHEKLFVYGSKNTKRILLYGLGNKKKARTDYLRSEGSKIYNYAKSKKIPTISVLVNSFKLGKDDKSIKTFNLFFFILISSTKSS